MKINEFDRIQRKNMVFAIIGGVIGIWGLTNHAFNKGLLNGRADILSDVYDKVVKENKK